MLIIMAKKKLTYIDVIDETVAFYSEDTSRRSLNPQYDDSSNDNNRCLYNGTNGRKCAFARCSGVIESSFEGKGAAYLLRSGKVKLKVKYRHLDNKDFWGQIQNLHDVNDNWNEKKGLTEDGKSTVKFMKIDFPTPE